MTTTISEHEVWPPDPATIDLNSRDWLTPSQAAGAARVSERTIWQLVADPRSTALIAALPKHFRS